MNHTLVIPTYNRPERLSRLLSYLERGDLESRVLILDSSEPPAMEQNRALVAAFGGEIEHRDYPSDLHPFLKMREGYAQVETEYCSACADDDVVFLPTLAEGIAFLDEHADYAAAHGNYVNFREIDDRFHLSYVSQRGGGVDGVTALRRLRTFLGDYDVLFYAIHRSDVARAAFRPMANLKTTLAREIASGAIVAAMGKVARLDSFYLGRSTDESASYDAWHPHQILADTPRVLFEDYGAFRSVLLEAIDEADGNAGDVADSIVDLICLRYLAPFMREDVMDFILDEKLELAHSAEQTIDNLWARFVATPDRTKHEQVPLFDDDNWTFRPGVLHPNAPRLDYLYRDETVAGERTYMFYNEFFFPEATPICSTGRSDTEFLLAQLANY